MENYTWKILFNMSKQNTSIFDGSGRTCEILFASDDKRPKFIDGTED